MFRFIPAGAGNTFVHRVEMALFTVYPRWRGEHHRIKLACGFSGGLSPLARGTPVQRRFGLYLTRFIPAGAGNTSGYRPERAGTAVYPRWRGEHTVALGASISWPGLSPLARGTLFSILRPDQRARFIPAGAGNTASSPILTPCAPVYPRWRGEH